MKEPEYEYEINVECNYVKIMGCLTAQDFKEIQLFYAIRGYSYIYAKNSVITLSKEHNPIDYDDVNYIDY